MLILNVVRRHVVVGQHVEPTFARHDRRDWNDKDKRVVGMQHRQGKLGVAP